VLPFLKWPGGKRWVAARISEIAGKNLVRCYYEPFLGGGAVFFNLQAERAVLSDVNPDLIDTYSAVKEDWRRVVQYLKRMPVSPEVYGRVRDSRPAGRFSRAARFLYLNRTAFGGIYRLNKDGGFNVPFGGGRTPNILWEQDLLRSASQVLHRARIIASDFQPMLDRTGPGDVVYCDPTYTVAHDNNGFVRYNEANFSWADQERLASAAHRASRRGACVLVSNAYHRDVRALYSGAVSKVLTRHSLVSPDPAARRLVREYLFVL
jgi:DNA adenine methylase